MPLPRLLIVMLCVASFATSFAAEFARANPNAARELYERVAPALCVVQFTLDTELGRVDVDSTGLVVREDGLVISSLGFARQSIPD